MTLMNIRVPDIGDFHDVTVIELLVQPGDVIRAEQSLMTVESDKASMEIPSSHAGVVKELKVALGDKVSQGTLIVVMEVAQETAQETAQQAPQEARQEVLALPANLANNGVDTVAPAIKNEASADTAVPVVDARRPAPGAGAAVSGAALPHASPSVRKFARELGVPLAEVKGTGFKGRITLQDVQGFTQAVMSGAAQTQAQAAKAPASGGAGLDLLPWPEVDFAKFGPIERQELSRIQKISGANLARNWVKIPHVTHCDEADITTLEALRVRLNRANEKAGIKLTLLAFLIKACVTALQKYPQFNSSLDGAALVFKRYWNIGFAADTPHGLVVPVLKNADAKGILQISQELASLSQKAREGKLSPAEMSGASFTISSLGGIGGTTFTPIINAPEVAILGVCRSQIKPCWNGKKFKPRLMLPLSLSYDHRVIDGAAAARFNAFLGQVLADFATVVL